jgi:hypothetical protein
MGWWHQRIPGPFGDLHARIVGLLYKPILHPSLVECLYEAFLLGAELDAGSSTITCVDHHDSKL